MRDHRRAFTLVELLVVITIIGMLMALAFPVLQVVIAQANRQSCAARLRDLALGAEAYVNANNDRYPALVERGKSVRGEGAGPIPWTARLLAHIGQRPIGDTWTNPKPGKAFVVARVPGFVCTEDDTATGDQPLSFVINAGAIEDATKPNPANGIALSRYLQGGNGANRSQISVDKSLSATILFAENLQAGNWGDRRTDPDRPVPYDGDVPTTAYEAQRCTGFVWNGYAINQGDGVQDFDVPAVAPTAKWARPSSSHADGVNVAMCGGGVRFLNQGVDRHVFQYLAVANPAKAAGSGLHANVATMVSVDEY